MTQPRKKGMPLGVMFAVGIAIAVAIGVGQAKAETVRFPTDSEARFSVTVTGTGPDVILIPGLGNSRDVWNATVDRFKGQYRLHVLNIAGFAGEPAGANATGEVIAPSVEALDAYIKAKKLNKPAIVGHSMGGLMALMIGAAHPEDAGKLVIVDAFPFIGTAFNQPTVDAIRPQAERFRSTIVNATPEQFETMQRGMIAGPNPPAYGEEMVGWTLKSDRRVMAQAMYDDMLTDVRPSLPTIKARIVMFYPHHARSGMSVEQADAVYKEAYSAAPSTQLIRVDNATHFLMLDQPEIFHAKLAEALK
jgi:pimeloyl-ACP methyl ester carboxylesterase